MVKLLFFMIALSTSAYSKEKKALIHDESIYQVQSKWTDQDGKSLQLADLIGKQVAISMIYLTCKFSCPLTINHMKDLEKLLSPKIQENIQFILVSFDPKRDTPSKMKKFALKHKLSAPKWRLITAKNEQDVRELSALIDFKYKKTANGEFEHSFGIVALDSQGVVLGSTIGAEMKETELAKLLEMN